MWVCDLWDRDSKQAVALKKKENAVSRLRGLYGLKNVTAHNDITESKGREYEDSSSEEECESESEQEDLFSWAKHLRVDI